ncbi:hypothetical protein ILUMI_07994 [Ignelater luminosus]|uniref:C2H2-type domain-containing protein n=1 Tax=Ignelater luminosus TaxID=2038154 RepID=A0A8K0GDU7_IGNLU|nr:hypothetical protein ILUMI_07994 [Ignelater luminosus]
MGSEKKRRRNFKNVKTVKFEKIVESCRNLLYVNTDHSYAAPIQSSTAKPKKNKGYISEPESETEETKITLTVTSDKTVETKERSSPPNGKVKTKPENVSLRENTESPKKTESSKQTQPLKQMEPPKQSEPPKQTEPAKQTESFRLTEPSKQTESFTQIESNSNINIETVDSSINTKMIDSSINAETVDNHANIESIFLKEEVVEASLEDIDESNKIVTVIKAKKDDKDPSCSKTSGNVNNIKGNLPEICILCATTNMSRKNYTLIIHFQEMIKDLSGVDILKSNVSPIACSICFKYVLEMWNFKQQIITADKFIKEKIPKQLGINLISTFGSRNVPKPVPFEYIDYNSPILKDTNKRKKQSLNVENVRRKKVTNKLFGGKTIKDSKNKKIDEITLVPIENILKEHDDATKDCTTASRKCTTYKNSNLKDLDCKKKQKKKEQEKFICPVCGKHYPAQRSLKRHEMIHNAKRYICDICKKAFHLKLYLIRHLRKHSVKKPFPCSYCNKRFSTKWNLSQHKRLHTNSLPYKCKLCPAAYRYNITLKKHIGMSHSANEFLRNPQNDNLTKMGIQ